MLPPLPQSLPLLGLLLPLLLLRMLPQMLPLISEKAQPCRPWGLLLGAAFLLLHEIKASLHAQISTGFFLLQ